ncbi:unnamed protein product [Cyclocybe aegerita]|uniref:Zinc/iron permease n=1 Tax=Cyclocybe aegerita TaxID=1973307 RepID=A0A8S0VQY2_CYCAE|nr:unnamed protein product [Cyclocybe aegerita]
MVLQLLVMVALLGASSFAVGMLPLSYAFSKSHLERLSALGTGLLLGAALGVIIPEGLEAIAEAHPKELPMGLISLCLVVGFVVMLVIEQLVSPNGRSHSFDDMHIPAQKARAPDSASQIEFDAELGDLDPEGRVSETASGSDPATIVSSDAGSGKERAFALLIGLVIHAAADGLALGVANVASGASSAFVVFLALVLHKAPTALAFTTSLLSTNLPRLKCKMYLVIFSLSTPISALASYFILAIFQGRDESSNLAGLALLASGGTFLYVATVLQPVSNHSPIPGDMRPASRVLFISLGMFIPLVLSTIFGHGH